MEASKKTAWLPYAGLVFMTPICLLYVATVLIEQNWWALASVTMYGGLSLYWFALIKQSARLANIGLVIALPGVAINLFDFAKDVL